VDWAAPEFPYGMQGINEPPPARGYACVPDTADATALEYNLTINGQQVTNLRLSGVTIEAIFIGAVTWWNDPLIEADNPGLAMPATLITPVVRSDQSGDTLAFTYGSEDLSQVYTDTEPRTYELSSYSYMIVPTDLSNGLTTDKGFTLGTFGQYQLCQSQQ
jgi:phosphate transport system substrate-binding protein